MCVNIDDSADAPSFTKLSQAPPCVYVRGRHNMISIITATHKLKASRTIIRLNAPTPNMYRLRTYNELEAVMYEVPTAVENKAHFSIIPYNTICTILCVYVQWSNKATHGILKTAKRLVVQDDWLIQIKRYQFMIIRWWR